LNYETVELDALKVDPNNINVHDEANRQAIRDSLMAFQQQKPLVVAADGTIVAGNGTYEVMCEMKEAGASWREDGGYVVDIVRTKLKGDLAWAYAIADNRSSDLSYFDPQQLAMALEHARQDDGLPALGFTEEQAIEAIEKAAKMNAAPDEFKEVDDDLETEYQCPKCAYEWSGSPKQS